MRRALSAAQRIDDDQQLHQIVVGGKARRLDDEHVLAADVLLDLDEHFHVGEAAHDRLGEGQFEILADGFGQRRLDCRPEASFPALRSFAHARRGPFVNDGLMTGF